ncbi:MAG: hypothetical protein NVSMB56_09410 [Pyrinomonadaceae bacterium]
MKNLVDILLWVVTIAAFGIAIWQFYIWETARNATSMNLWTSIGAAVIGCVGILGYFLRHVNKEEEIHITQ